MPGPVFLEGETVTLHPVEETDLEVLQRWVNDPRIRPDIGSYAPVNGREEREWWERDDDGVTLLAVADGEAVAHVGYGDVNEAWGTAEVGYMADPDHWGEGYTTDALRTLVRHAFEERRLDKLTASVYEHNDASRRVLAKVGFEREGVHRKEAFVRGERVDVLRFGLLAGELDTA